MITDLVLKQVARDALKGIKPIQTTYSMHDGVEVETNEYYNAEQMMQMFLNGWERASKYILQEVKKATGGEQ